MRQVYVCLEVPQLYWRSVDPKHHNELLADRTRRENITVHVCFSASGTYVPPYIVYTGKRLILSHMDQLELYGISPSGWMMQVTFIDWFKSLFVPSLPQECPFVLIQDCHNSHLTYELCVLAKENDVHLIKLPSHLTHFLQPLYMAFFKPLKAEWSKVAEDFTWREMKLVSKVDFPSLFSTAGNNASKPQHALSGFRCTGIYPYNAISSQVHAPNERFKIDANDRTYSSEEGNNEDEDYNQDNSDNDDNDCIDTEHDIEHYKYISCTIYC